MPVALLASQRAPSRGAAFVRPQAVGTCGRSTNRQAMRRTIVLCALLAAIGFGPAAGTAAPATASLVVSAAAALYGDQVVATGSVDPATAGEEVVLELQTGESWSQVARTTTDAAGTFAVMFEAVRGGALVAHAVGSGALSEAVEITVTPRVTARVGRTIPFANAVVSATIIPATYAGRVTFTIKREGRIVAKAYARHGRRACAGNHRRASGGTLRTRRVAHGGQRPCRDLRDLQNRGAWPHALGRSRRTRRTSARGPPRRPPVSRSRPERKLQP